MTDDNTYELLSLLARKHSILRTVDREETVTFATINADTEDSKSTISRTLNTFESAGLVETTNHDKNRKYSLTFLGKQLVDWLGVGVEHLEKRRMFTAVPSDASLPSWVISDGTTKVVSEMDNAARYKVFDQILEFISRVDRFRVVAPALTRDATFNHLADEILKNGLTAELVIPDQFFNLFCDRFPEKMNQFAQTGRVTVYTLEQVDLPYGFGLGYTDNKRNMSKEEVAVVCYDEHYHNANGTVVTDTPYAVAWAEAQYQQYKDSASDRTPDLLQISK